MRDTTKIKAIAEEILNDWEDVLGSVEMPAEIAINLKEIVAIAERMDARTGTVDPSRKRAPKKGKRETQRDSQPRATRAAPKR
jgi:hypothetical protein